LAFGRFDPFSALGCVLRTASVSIWRSSAFVFGGSRVKLDFCHLAIVGESVGVSRCIWTI
jgi:hypothetical protein